MNKRTLRAVYVLLLLAAIACIAPYLPAGVFRGSVERALTRSLHREVRIGDIRFTFFPAGPVPGPGFALEDVTIHEDSRAGIEPFAHMDELGASVRILSLLRGRLELSGINLGDANINLVKTSDGPWNFQLLVDQLAAQDAAMPALRMRAGRVNIKFGDTKSVVYFDEADLDIATGATGMDIRFSGAPGRTDHTSRDFGRFFARGTVSASNHLDLQLELQSSSLEEILRLMDPQGYGVHGVLALTATLSGDASKMDGKGLDVEGKLSLGDVHRWDLLPDPGQAWQLPFKGLLDLHAERLNLESVAVKGAPAPIIGVRLSVWDYLKTPVWSTGVDFHEMPLATLLGIAKHMGATLPDKLIVDGAVSGSAAYDQRDGLAGQFNATGASLKLPDQEPMRAESAALRIRNGSVYLDSTMVSISPDESAQVEGNVDLASPHALDLKVTTRGLNVGAMRSFGLPAIPVLGETPMGDWKGWARYHDGSWTSESQLTGARLAVDGIAEPVTVNSAVVHLSANRLRVEKMAGTAGNIAFTMNYDAHPMSAQAAKFTLNIVDADAAEVERLLAPTLTRDGPGFIARTLRLRSAPPAPAWLKARLLEGAITIDAISAGDWHARGLKTQIAWNGTSVRLTALTAQMEPAALAGKLDVDLSGSAPKYHLDGTANGIAYRGGSLDVSGIVDAEGTGLQLLEAAHAEGTAKGRAIAFAPEADFRTVSAAFLLQPSGTNPRWKLSNLEVTQAGATLLGSGASQEDGRLLLDLAQGDSKVHYAGTVFPPAGK